MAIDKVGRESLENKGQTIRVKEQTTNKKSRCIRVEWRRSCYWLD